VLSAQHVTLHSLYSECKTQDDTHERSVVFPGAWRNPCQSTGGNRLKQQVQVQLNARICCGEERRQRCWQMTTSAIQWAVSHCYCHENSCCCTDIQQQQGDWWSGVLEWSPRYSFSAALRHSVTTALVLVGDPQRHVLWAEPYSELSRSVYTEYDASMHWRGQGWQLKEVKCTIGNLSWALAWREGSLVN